MNFSISLRQGNGFLKIQRFGRERNKLACKKSSLISAFPRSQILLSSMEAKSPGKAKTFLFSRVFLNLLYGKCSSLPLSPPGILTCLQKRKEPPFSSELDEFLGYYNTHTPRLHTYYAWEESLIQSSILLFFSLFLSFQGSSSEAENGPRSEQEVREQKSV